MGRNGSQKNTQFSLFAYKETWKCREVQQNSLAFVLQNRRKYDLLPHSPSLNSVVRIFHIALSWRFINTWSWKKFIEKLDRGQLKGKMTARQGFPRAYGFVYTEPIAGTDSYCHPSTGSLLILWNSAEPENISSVTINSVQRQTHNFYLHLAIIQNALTNKCFIIITLPLETYSRATDRNHT